MDPVELTFHTDLVTLNYAEIVSPNSPLVLLHGGNASWRDFDAVLPDFAESYHIYAPDFRGQGQSGWVKGSYRLQDYADDTIAFLREVVREPAFIYGHSLGGIVGLLVASQYPAGVRALVVGDAPLTASTWHKILLSSEDRLRAWRDLCGGQVTDDALLEALKNSPTEVWDSPTPVPMRVALGEDSPAFPWLVQCLRQSDPDMLTALIDHFEATAAGYEMEQYMPAITCPVLLLQADPNGGGLMADGEVQQALALLQKPVHTKLEGVSHILHNQHKEPVVKAIQAFLRSLSL